MSVLGRLFPAVLRGPGETPPSWLGRIAGIHSGQPVRDFCRLIGLSRLGVWRGDDDALSALARLGGEDVTRLDADALKRRGGGEWILRGQRLCARTVLRDRVRFCPACLLRDASEHTFRTGIPWRQRVLWLLRAYEVCPVHHLRLAEIPLDRRGLMAAEFQALIGADSARVNAALDAAEPARPSALQDYVEGRLSGLSGPAFLDAHDLRDAINVTEMIGAAALRGIGIWYSDVASGRADELAAGFDVMSRGEAGLRTFFEGAARRANVSDLTRFAPRATFGVLHGFFAGGGPGRFAGPSREIFRDVLFQTFPYEAGANVGGEAAPGPAGITVYQAGKTYGIHRKRFRRVLEAEGQIPPGETRPQNFILLDTNGAEVLARDLNSALRFIDLPAYLGCSRSVAESLVRHQVIVPIGQGRLGLRKTGFRRSDLDRLMDDLMRSAEPVAGETVGWLGLVSHTRHLGVSSGRIIDAAVTGDLPDMRRLVELGRQLDALRFLEAAAKEILCPDLFPGELPVNVAARMMRTTSLVVLTLSDRKWGSDGLVAVRRLRWHGRERPLFRVEAIEEFRARYAFLIEEARKLRLFAGEAVRRLDERGVTPAFPPVEVHARVYRREARFFEALQSV